MIYLKKGQILFDNPGVVVWDQTGYYNDDASVLCAPVYAPDEASSRFEAKYIAFGQMVYSITDPVQLLEEIKKIDPANLYGKTGDQIAYDQKVQDIEVVKPQENPDEPQNNENQEEPTPEIPENKDPETPENVAPVEPDVPNDPEVLGSATSTVTTSTTTPVIEEPLPPIVEATTTPVVEEVVPVLENVIEELGNVSEVLQNATSTEVQN